MTPSPGDKRPRVAAVRPLPKGLGAHAADRIRDMIIDGELAPGAHLVEADLAAELGVSPGTARAAIHSLRHEGLVEYLPNRGIFVASMTAEDAWEVYSLRNNLEGMAARLAAERITADGRLRLRDGLDRMRRCAEPADHAGLASADRELHELIVQLAGHRRLGAAHQVIHVQTALFMNLTKGFHTDPAALIAKHEELVRAILDGDADLAERLGRSHNTADGEQLRTLLDGAGKAGQAASQ